MAQRDYGSAVRAEAAPPNTNLKGLESNQDGGKVGLHSRCAFGFAIEDDLRFISHHDTLRLFRRALARAQLPIRFSQGFNPQPRIVIPLPRPVGVASDDETVVVDFNGEPDVDEMYRRLAHHLPPSVRLHQVQRLAANEKLHPHQVEYRFEPEGLAADDLRKRVQEIAKAQDLPVQRDSPKYESPRTVDVRPFLAAMTVDGTSVTFTLNVTQDGTARPSEIAALLGFDPRYVNHRIRRMRVRWQ